MARHFRSFPTTKRNYIPFPVLNPPAEGATGDIRKTVFYILALFLLSL